MAASAVLRCHTLDIRKRNTRSLMRILTNATGSLFARDIALHMQGHPTLKQQEFVEPEQFKFKDDGVFPNSDLPLLLYRQAFSREAEDAASVIEQSFAENH